MLPRRIPSCTFVVRQGLTIEGVVRELMRQLVSVLDLKVLASFRSGAGTDEALAAQRRINRRIVDAFREAKGGVAVVDGKMVDRPLVLGAEWFKADDRP